ncbi:MAG: TonB family protein [Bacteroidota bacterium]
MKTRISLCLVWAMLFSLPLPAQTFIYFDSLLRPASKAQATLAKTREIGETQIVEKTYSWPDKVLLAEEVFQGPSRDIRKLRMYNLYRADLKLYFPDGSLKSHGTFSPEISQSWQHFFPDGTLRAKWEPLTNQKGKYQGSRRSWFRENGKKLMEESPGGEVKAWHPNGQLSLTCQKENIIAYDSAGQVIAFQDSLTSQGIIIQEPIPLNMGHIRRLIGYPKLARDAGIEGLVVYALKVNDKGEPQEFFLFRSSHPTLDDPIQAALPLLKFSPAQTDQDIAVPMWVFIPFNFKLLN